MKMPTTESAGKATALYAGLKMILCGVGLENHPVLSPLTKYLSLAIAFSELIEEEFNFIYPYLKTYSQEAIEYFTHKHLYITKINALCTKNNQHLALEHQKNILTKICNSYNSSANQTNEALFNNAYDNFKAVCIIVGDQDICLDILT